ncbi:MAG TPA: hypothetical protein PLB52_03945 [Candidatus Moranbacteria bacterium]|nr:hypothetical protein [Candidatus Moranbacteria bacterium]
MIDQIERTVSDYIEKNKKSDDNKSGVDFASDTVSVAKNLDDHLNSLKSDFARLKLRIGKDRNLLQIVKDSLKEAVKKITE